MTSFLTKADHAAEALRAAVTSGQIPPGEWIRAEDWAQRLELSVTPVREALRQLETLGLVTIHPHRGARVTKRTRTELMEDCRIRIALESLAIAVVLERSDDASLAALLSSLRDCATEYRRVAKTGDSQACLAFNDRFHSALYAAAHSPRLQSMLQSVWSAFPIYTVQLGREFLLVAADQHEQLIEAIADRDAERANRIIAEHAIGLLNDVPDVFDGTAMFADTPTSVPSAG